MVAYSGFTASTGDATTGTWNDVVSYCPDTTMTTNNVTFESVRDTVWKCWTATSDTITPTGEGSGTANSIWLSPPAPVPVQFGRTRQAAPLRADDTGNVDNYPPPPSRLQQLKKRLRTVGDRRKRKQRGLDLLRSIVTAEQWRDFRRYGSVREVGEHAVYEVGCGWSGHIYELDFEGEPKRKLCVQMGTGQYGKGWTKGDRIAAVLLALRNDEEEVVRLAGKHRWGEHEKDRVRARRGHLVEVAA